MYNVKIFQHSAVLHAALLSTPKTVLKTNIKTSFLPSNSCHAVLGWSGAGGSSGTFCLQLGGNSLLLESVCFVTVIVV